MKYQPDATFCFYTDETGNAYATTRGVNRLVDENGHDTKFYNLNGIELNGSMSAEVPTAGGIQRVELWGVRDIKNVVKYYAKKGKLKAEETLDAFLEVSATVFIQDRTGFNTAHETVKPLFNWLDLRERAIQVNLLIMNTCPEAFDALNVAYFGIPCRKHKEARVIQPEAVYENLPDYVDTDELQELLYLREQFNRTRGKMPDRVTKAVQRTAKVYSR